MSNPYVTMAIIQMQKPPLQPLHQGLHAPPETSAPQTSHHSFLLATGRFHTNGLRQGTPPHHLQHTVSEVHPCSWVCYEFIFPLPSHHSDYCIKSTHFLRQSSNSGMVAQAHNASIQEAEAGLRV